jgi:hypothetical protein
LPESESDRLYALPLEEFVRERDALAKRLRDEGNREEADAVKRLRKPSVVAWAVNQLAHRRPDELGRFLETADRLRDAQTGRSGDFAEAAAAERDAVRKLTRTAGSLLSESGRSASGATLDRVARTLHAAAADDEARAELERGVLTEEVEATGFGGLLGALSPSARKAAAPKKAEERDDRAERRKEARAALARARAHARELRQDATAAEREAAQLRRAAERAERDAQQARGRAEGAEAEVERADQRLRDL